VTAIASEVDVMASVVDRVRRFVVDGAPIVTGLLAVGDASACTSPSLGRGISIALLHVTCLRDALRAVSAQRAVDFAQHWYELTDRVIAPLVNDTLQFDRHRLAQIEAQIAGVPYETDDVGWNLGQALGAAARQDPDLLRASISIATLLERGVDVFRRDGFVDKVLATPPGPPAPGPSRSELLDIIGAAPREDQMCASK
jgi:hypothetical protein